MDILYQDRRILGAVKPAGVLSTDEPGGMPSLLRTFLGDEKACVRTVHRLDAAVSGVMVFARSARAASLLSEQIRERQFQKEYLAVVHGCPDVEQGTLTDLLLRDKARKMTMVVTQPGKGVQDAVLEYEVVAKTECMSRVQILLKTGRTHQIRVQFASRGFPLVGDHKYGSRDEEKAPMLYSCCITLPYRGQTRQFSHFPQWMP